MAAFTLQSQSLPETGWSASYLLCSLLQKKSPIPALCHPFSIIPWVSHKPTSKEGPETGPALSPGTQRMPHLDSPNAGAKTQSGLYRLPPQTEADSGELRKEEALLNLSLDFSLTVNEPNKL